MLKGQVLNGGMSNRPGETLSKRAAAGETSGHNETGGQLQTQPTSIVCWDSEDKTGQCCDICKHRKGSPQQWGDPNRKHDFHSKHRDDVILFRPHLHLHPPISSCGHSVRVEEMSPQEDVLVLTIKPAARNRIPYERICVTNQRAYNDGIVWPQALNSLVLSLQTARGTHTQD